MAHYAEIVDGKVQRVVVLDNAWSKNQCQAWLREHLSENKWVQTSYNARIRGKFAGIGDEYHEDLDVFIQRPCDSWVLNKEKKCYEPPIPMPDDGKYYCWCREEKKWVETEKAPLTRDE